MRQRVGLGVFVVVAAAVISALTVWAGDFRDAPGGLTAGAAITGPIITELVPANASTLADEDGDFSDWLELHNPTDVPIDLGGYFLSDDDSDPTRWELPSTVLEPGGHVVVFASGKDRAPASGELHTNFSIARDGEAVTLTRPNARGTADRLEPGVVPTDASFGRDPSALERTCYFAFPTPAATNGPECYEDAELGAPGLSTSSGFHPDAFDLVIIPAYPDNEVIYTLDGSYPDLEANPARTRIYDAPLRITDRSDDPNRLSTVSTTVPETEVGDWAFHAPPPDEPVHKGTVVRARTEHSAEQVASYFVGEQLVRDDLPVFSLAVDEDHLFDHDTGIYVAGAAFDEYRASEEFDPDRGWPTPANYHQRGRAGERPFQQDLRNSAVFDHCAPGGECDFQTRTGLRIHGNYSRSLPQKSLRLYARNDYGSRTFDHALFGDAGPDTHRRLLLRNSGQDARGLLFLDGYLQSLMTGLEADTQSYQPTVLFINGEYWGIHNLRERYDRHYLAETHGAQPDEVIILGREFEVEAGPPDSNDDFESLLAFIAAGDVDDPAVIERVEAEVDLDSFFDFVIAHVLVGNWDWPGNNARLWREPGGPDAVGEGVRDGRWRWLVFDLDFMGQREHRGEREALYNVDYDIFTDRFAPNDDLDVEDGYPLIFHRLTQNEDLRDRFLARFADQLNTSFRTDRTLPRLDHLEALLADEIDHHANRWGQPESQDSWREEVEQLRAFMRNRPDRQREHLIELFDLTGTTTIQVATDQTAGTVYVNGTDIAAEDGTERRMPWSGVYFEQGTVRLEAVPQEGYQFSHWDGLPAGQARSASVELVAEADLELTAVFDLR